jgi:putative ATP-binding cassette transporter
VLIVAPLYVHGEVPFGAVTQAVMAFAHVLGAFSLIVTEFQRLSAFAAVIARLGALGEAVEELPVPGGIILEMDSDHVVFDHLTLVTPKDGRVLLSDLNLEILAGRRLLVVGPNASGCSTLMRAAAGLWTSGRGRIARPPQGEVMFLPAQPYLLPGTLRDQLVYCACGPVGETSDDQLLHVLRAMQLEPVLTRAGGLHTEGDWPKLLSASEQQLLALARLLLAAPRFAFLDGATNALEPPRVRQVYEVLAKTSITYVSVGMSDALRAYHDQVLEMRADETWGVRDGSAMNC